MRTDDLITALAADTRPIAPGAPARRIGLAALAGGAVALAGVVAWLGLRPDLPAAIEPLLERQREALELCMQKVPEEQRGLLMQAYQPDSSIQTVAQGSGRSVPGFYQWLHRMRKLLLDCIRRAMTQEVAS